MVDTYGGVVQHGGGAFSGKDPTKIDRAAGYMARYIAKTIVAAGLADRCLVEFAYAKGVEKPVMLAIHTFDTGKVSESRLLQLVHQHLDLTLEGMIEKLRLRRPIYRKTSVYGHFGRDDPDFVWENPDLAPIWQQQAHAR